MNPLPGIPLTASGRLHVAGARHPLERGARAFATRGAFAALLVHLAASTALVITRNVAVEPPPIDLRDERERDSRPIEIPPPPVINPARRGIAIPDVKPAGRSAELALADPVPVRDLDAEAQSIADMSEMGLEVGDGGVEGAGEGGLGLGGPARPLDTGAIVRPDAVVLDWAERMPALIEMPPPEYPRIAREAGIEGRVLILATVGTDGRVIDTKVVEGSDVLAAAAVAAIRAALFSPGLQNGHPVIVRVAVPILFTIR